MPTQWPRSRYFPNLKTIHAGDLIIDAMPVIDYDAGGTDFGYLQISTTQIVAPLGAGTVSPAFFINVRSSAAVSG